MDAPRAVFGSSYSLNLTQPSTKLATTTIPKVSVVPADPAQRRHRFVVREILNSRGVHRNHGAFR